MRKKKVLISVISDLVTDQRVHKTAETLYDLGFEVHVLGRKLKLSKELETRRYSTSRVTLPFEKGAKMYALFDIYLFFYLLFKKADILHSNDLDTLLPSYLVSKFKGIPVVYDSHEYFTGVPEIQNKPFVKLVWGSIEKFVFPKLKHVYTVNQSIADIYTNLYKVKVGVVKNMPMLKQLSSDIPEIPFRDQTKKLLIFQGAAFNTDRGGEEAVQAMQYIDNAQLLMIGAGDVFEDIKKISDDLGLTNTKVIFVGKMPHADLMNHTKQATLGLSFDKPSNDNYKFSLPNKLFDYLHAGIPVLSSKVVEVQKVIDKYQVGSFIENHNPVEIATKINEILINDALLSEWKNNTKKAALECNWQHESELIKNIYAKL